jgi:hypothetical protein
MRFLGDGFAKAVAGIEGWERDVRERTDLLAGAVAELGRATDAELPGRLSEARLRWRAFSERLSVFRIEEDLG